MAKKTIIIIGAGLAGLSAGCYAQMNGYQTHIFEHANKPGGVAAAWRRKDYLIDGGIHFLMGHRPGQPIYDLYRELGTADDDCCVDMTTYGRFIDEPTGLKLDITCNLDQLADDLKAIGPDDGKLIDDLISGARAIQGVGSLFEAGMGKPPELMGPTNYLGMLWDTGKAIGIRKMLGALRGNYTKSMAEYSQTARNQMLRGILANLFYPEVPVWFILMLFALLQQRQMGLLAQGCPGFVQPIEKRYKALGGEVTYKATVKQIVVENDRAVGVRLADGTEHRADAVVSAADGYGTIFEMLGGRYTDKNIEQRYRNWSLIRPWVMVSFGVAREFKDEAPITSISLERPFGLGGQKINEILVRLFNYSDKFAPPGKTVVQVSLETDWDFWNNLRQNRTSYDAEKQRVAEEVLTRLGPHYSGISKLVEVTDVATPYTTWRYTLNRRGAYMGWLPTPKNMMTFIPRTLPRLADFYMAGQWVMPGGGVPPCLYSGRHVVQLLCKRDGKKFSTTKL